MFVSIKIITLSKTKKYTCSSQGFGREKSNVIFKLIMKTGDKKVMF